MKKLKYSAPFDSRDYFTQNILPTAILADQKTIRKQIPYASDSGIHALRIVCAVVYHGRIAGDDLEPCMPYG